VAVLAGGLALAFPQRSLADPPTYTSVPPNILVEADSEAGFASVEFTLPTATDDNGDPDVFCDHASGTDFEVGTTTVTCTAEDPETGEQSSVSFSVRVLAHAQEEGAAGGVNALLYYNETEDRYGQTVFKNVRLTIIRKGTIAFQGLVPRYPGRERLPVNPAGYGERQSVFVRDLDGDGDPEVRLDLFWGGAHCCFWTDVYRHAGSSYLMSHHFFGDAGYRLADMNHDSRPEFLSGDYRFGYAFTAFAFSPFPIQLWSYKAGRFGDVTRRYPEQIRRDAVHWWGRLGSFHRSAYPNGGLLAAWAADQYRLHHKALVWKRLGALARVGQITSDYSSSAYLRKLRRFLARLGYAR
jgi:hypothetical protein